MSALVTGIWTPRTLMTNGSSADSVRPSGTGGTMLPQVPDRIRLSPNRISRAILITVYGDGQPLSSMRYA